MRLTNWFTRKRNNNHLICSPPRLDIVIHTGNREHTPMSFYAEKVEKYPLETIWIRDNIRIFQMFPIFLEAFLLCSKVLKSHWTKQSMQE